MPRRDLTSSPPPAATAVDLLCGAGGLTRGLLDAGISVAAGYDVDEACRFPYEHNNKGAAIKKMGISRLSGADLVYSGLGPIELIPHTPAGKKQRTGKNFPIVYATWNEKRPCKS